MTGRTKPSVSGWRQYYEQCLSWDFLPLLGLRLYLGPVFWVAGIQKLMHIHGTATLFGNAEWGYGLPYPELLAYAVGGLEAAVGLSLALGLGVRVMARAMLGLLLIMIAIMYQAHGWYFIAGHSHEATQRLNDFLIWIERHHPQRYTYITELGRPVVLKQGIELLVGQFLMVWMLAWQGAGRFLSFDYYLKKCFR